jgi:hypothetical protein
MLAWLFAALLQSGSPPAVNLPLTIDVRAERPWTDTGLAVTKGQSLVFDAAGTVVWGTRPDETAGPQGTTNKKDGRLGKGGLIGRVGYSGRPFAIGSSATPLRMPKSGRLFLGINDFVFSDNRGAFTVTIRAGNGAK